MSEYYQYEEKPHKPIYKSSPKTHANLQSNVISNDVIYTLTNTNNALLIALGEEISNIKLNSNKLLTELNDEIKNIKFELNKVTLSVSEVVEKLSQFDIGVEPSEVPTEEPDETEEQEETEETEEPTEETEEQEETEDPTEDSNIIDKVN
jgi:hypothetical protein